MNRKQFAILAMSVVGTMLFTATPFWIKDWINELGALRTSERVATSMLWQALAERDAARDEAAFLLEDRVILFKEIDRVSGERNWWIREHGRVDERYRRITEERIACEDRERARKEVLEARTRSEGR